MATVQECTLSDTLWKWSAPLLLVPKAHTLGCHRRRIPDRDVLSIIFVLRTGYQWKILDTKDLCKGSTAHSQFQHGVEAGVFARF